MPSIFANEAFAGSDPCTVFCAHLDQWLAEELDAHDGVDMRLHHDACETCAREARLARGVDSVVRALPEQLCPPLSLPTPAHTHGYGFISRLLAAWRQPLVFVPVFAALFVAIAVIQMGLVRDAAPRTVVVNGEEYTQEEIMQAAQELETALHYLEKYSSYPARVVTAELEESRLPLPSAQTPDVPTI